MSRLVSPLATGSVLNAEQGGTDWDVEDVPVGYFLVSDGSTWVPTAVSGITPNLNITNLTAVNDGSAYDAVFADGAGGVDLTDSSGAATSLTFLGLLTDAVAMGDLASVQYGGVIENPAWTWVQGAVYLDGMNGAISQTPPVSGVVYQIGIALTATSMIICPKQPIVL